MTESDASGFEAVVAPTAGFNEPFDAIGAFDNAQRRVARLERHGRHVATGFLVAHPALLLTTWHSLCLEGKEPSLDGMVAVFDFTRGRPDGHFGTTTSVEPIRVLRFRPAADEELFPIGQDRPVPPHRLDFALILLEHPPPEPTDAHGTPLARGFYLLDPHPADCTVPLLVFQHPAGRPLMHSPTRDSPRLSADGRRVRYDANTLPGSSGGPVTDHNGRLVAMHQGGARGGPHAAPRNQGVPIHLIARALADDLPGILAGLPDAGPPGGGVRHRVGTDSFLRGVTALTAELRPLLGQPRAFAAPHGPEANAGARTALRIVEQFGATDRWRSLGAEAVAAAVRTVEVRAGDGAVTAAVLAGALVEGADRLLAAGTPSGELWRDASAALASVRRNLASSSEPCRDPAAVVAWTTRDRDVAEAVARAAGHAGGRGVLLCLPGDSRGVETRTTDGLRIPAGHAVPQQGGGDGQASLTLRHPLVMLLDQYLEDSHALQRLAARVRDEKRALLIVTTVHDPQLHAEVRTLGDASGVPVAVVRLDGGRHRLRALAVLTGATILTPESGLPARTALLDLELLGGADLAVVSAEETVLVGGHGAAPLIGRWTASARTSRDRAEPARRAEFDEMLAWLSARATCLHVGGESPADLLRRTAEARRAVRAAQAALRSGTVPGAGVGLLAALVALPDTATAGAQVVRDGLQAPFRLLAGAAGVPGADIDRLASDPAEADKCFGSDGCRPRDATEVLTLAVECAGDVLRAFLHRVRP